MAKPSGCFEIQKVIGISTIHGNCRSYQVQWAPSWLSGAHLIGCENLIEQFEQEQRKEEVNIRLVIPDEQVQKEEQIYIKIELPDEEQKEIEDNPEIAETDLQSSCGLTVIASDNEEMMLGYNMHKHSAPMQEIQKQFQKDVSKDTMSYSSLNDITHQSNVRLKFSSLDSVIQKISAKSDNDVSRNTLHPDFLQVKTEDNEMDTEVDGLGQLGTNSTACMDIASEESNYDATGCMPLQGFHNFGHPERNTSIPVIYKYNKSFGSSKMKTMNSSNVINNINLSNVKLHNDIHECIICYKTFESKESFQKHKIKLHNACSICEMAFSSPHNLKEHIETHKTVKVDPLECSYCEKTFQHKSLLVIHERVHTGERPFQCNICQKGFKQPNQLKAHQQVHVKKYKLTEADEAELT